jgi:L-cysteine:1D-myo-inositol 2-amino-2-deoxy-alpha-D-glucopyranoside ligase
MHLYDTARQAVVPFNPGPLVTMYTCGITPYDATHLGHAWVYVNYDVLTRRLIDRGHEVRCVRNVTDVDDPLFAKARELGIHYLDLAAREEARFKGDMDALNVLPVYAEPRASSAISEIRKFIGLVLDAGYAYASGGSVYFDVAKFPSFGTVSHYDHDQMMAYAKERGGNVDDPNKRHPLDFVLWQPSKADEPAWETKWGAGKPGWHIECSAMALQHLGTTIDLHGGGGDLIFPHHECERAQSEAATGQPFVKHWMHVGLVWMDGVKMSKSLGNLVFIDALRKEFDPRAIRLGILDHPYRHDWHWEEDLMPRNAARLDRWLAAAGSTRGSGLLDAVRARLDDDLDCPGTIALIDDAAAEGADIRASAALLGIDL